LSLFPGAFEFHGILVCRDEDDQKSFYYVPAAPLAELDPQGHPTLMVWASNDGAILQLGTRWTVDSKILDELSKHLAEQFHIDLGSIRLAPLAAVIDSVTLTIGNGMGQNIRSQSASSAGYPPFAAIFNVKLTAEEKSNAIAALNGSKSLVAITYRGTISIPVTAETTIEGDVQADLAELRKNASLEDCRARIAAAVDAGRLHLKRSATAASSDSMGQRADQIAKEKAAVVLRQLARGERPTESVEFDGERTHLFVSAALTEKLPQSLERVADISSWFPEGKGIEHLRMVGSEIGAGVKPPSSAAVRLSFDARKTPVAFVHVTKGKDSQVLRSPGFSPVTFTLTTVGEPLISRTNYTVGGPPYESTALCAEGGWSLGPPDLGLALVTVDATARRKAGATSARVRVHYRPSGGGTEDEQVITFRYGDWTESWYVITRAPDICGSFDVECEETNADGSIARRSQHSTDSTLLIL